MRATSLRRAPQRLTTRLVGSTRIVPDGSCPECDRVVAINPSGYRRAHRDPKTKRPCLGSHALVGAGHDVIITELPPITLPTSRRGRNSSTCADCGALTPLRNDGRVRRHRIRYQDPTSPYCPGGET